MFTIVLKYLLILTFFYKCGAHVSHRGSCPKIDFPMKDFDPDKLTGTWYVLRSFDADASCLKINYTRCGEFCMKISETKQLSLISRMGVTNVYKTDGYLRLHIETPSKMMASFRTNPGPAKYIVLDTDYDNQVLIFTCQNIGLAALPLYHRRDVYLLARNRSMELTHQHITKVSQALISNKIEDEFSSVDHKKCINATQADLDLNASRLGQRMSEAAVAVRSGLGTIVDSISNIFSNSQEPASIGVSPL